MTHTPCRGMGNSIIPAHVSTERLSPQFSDELAVHGLFLGVVLKTYAPGANEGIYLTSQKTTGRYYYADVLVWRDAPPQGPRAADRALVLMDMGLHEGSALGLRGCSFRLSDGVAPDFNRVADLSDLDGDQVIVAFLDQSRVRPVILGRVSSVFPDAGNIRTINEDVAAGLASSAEDHILNSPGHRLRLGPNDLRNALTKFNGAVTGIDGEGNLLIDLVRAHDGALLLDRDAQGLGVGREPRPDGGGFSGNARIRIPQGSELVIEVINEEDFARGPSDVISSPRMRFTLTTNGLAISSNGDSTKHVTLVEPLRALYESLAASVEQIKSQLASHTHPIVPPGGASTQVPVTAPAIELIQIPAWDPGIESTAISVPSAGEPGALS